VQEPKPGKKLYYRRYKEPEELPALSLLASMGEIYCIVNNRTGLRYIGQTKCLKSIGGKMVYRGYKYRFQQHLKQALANKKDEGCPILHKAIRLYGSKMFYVRLVERCFRNELNAKEIFYIKYYKTRVRGYNVSRGGQRYRKKKKKG
jgi:hypothetical protein